MFRRCGLRFALCPLEASAVSRPPISHRAAFSGPVFRRCGRPLGVFHNSVWSSRIARKLACGSPMCPQLAIVALLRNRLQASCLSVQHGRSASSHRPALTLARCSVAAHCALLRVLATPALRASDVRKLTRGVPCVTGLTGGYCSHWLRRLFRPHWTSTSPVSRTARGLRAPRKKCQK